MDENLISVMLKNNIDPQMSEHLLEIINNPDFRNSEPVLVKGIPSFDGKTIVDISGSIRWEGSFESAKKNLENLTDTITIPDQKSKNGKLILNREELEEIGLHLLPFTSLGILNGGSATSYIDYL